MLGNYITWETIKAIFQARGYVTVGRMPNADELTELSSLHGNKEIAVIRKPVKRVIGGKLVSPSRGRKYFIRLKDHTNLPPMD